MIPSLEDIAKSQGKTIDIQLEEIPDLLLDEDEINYLIRSLVNNALDSMVKGGKASIITHKEEKTLSLSIHDNGSGIEPEILNQLGTPFLTTKDSGIGLSFVICKSIVMRHNATLKVESSHLGTIVQIKFDI
ncbi:MAG: hypothetical protein HGJ97_18875 [Desulfosporosinus sp.]|nr:hypothetical protein [Desulfosporosinus sp.]